MAPLERATTFQFILIGLEPKWLRTDGDDFLDHLDDLDFADGTVLGLQRGYTIHKKKTVESEDLSADKREQATAKNEDGPFDARLDPRSVRSVDPESEKRASSIVRSEPG
mmetsp:Transcript_5020/g.5935  ORF Transcript_5020/g.5935 Transcript_5020/m.5935 type:complete len:110 (-) Transcript_5020:42-371(-)